MALHLRGDIFALLDETATVISMNFLTFVSGDTAKAKELLAPGYIQHNLAFGTGADAFVAAVEGLAQAPVKTTVNNIRAFEDGDLFRFHESPNPGCPVGRNIHLLLDDKLKSIQEAMESDRSFPK